VIRRFGSFPLALAGITVVALLLRVIFPTADPPTNPFMGIVWHDEGAWVHNARIRVLFGQWSLDAWNPMYLAPVFTALEYVSFMLFGVGVWQARLVSEMLGVISVVALALGVRRIAGDTGGIIAGALLATNYVYVMFNRAAVLEATMVAFMVVAWYGYTRAQERPVWGALAAIAALLAFFSKAAAAFFVGAIGLEALVALWRPSSADSPACRRAAVATMAGFAIGGAIALAVFVVPAWTEFRFYNWQMSVTRKPAYTMQALVDRASWFPVLHDSFTRMWLILALSVTAALAALSRWRSLTAPVRLLLLWGGLGAIELMIHDVGNERRFLLFIPAFAALAAIVLSQPSMLRLSESAMNSRRRALIALPIVLYAAYVLSAPAVRLMFLYEIRPVVRLSAAVAVLVTAALYATWPAVPRLLARQHWTRRQAFIVAAILCVGDVAQFVQWAAGRTYENYEASLAIGRALPAGTLVHGKLANGLALENRIRPVFVGRNFGNYADRKTRSDIRYLLTYTEPCVGYEGDVINDVIAEYPNHRVLMEFDVAETPSGDRAALVDKFGDSKAPRREGDTLGAACP
jgi:4-amino-4-deoxy-L-arabinose transferase-like glycosyltransferase